MWKAMKVAVFFVILTLVAPADRLTDIEKLTQNRRTLFRRPDEKAKLVDRSNSTLSPLAQTDGGASSCSTQPVGSGAGIAGHPGHGVRMGPPQSRIQPFVRRVNVLTADNGSDTGHLHLLLDSLCGRDDHQLASYPSQ